MLINNAIHAGVDAVSLTTDLDFGFENLDRARIKLAHFDQSDKGIENSATDLGETDEINIDLKYKFTSGLLEKLTLRMYAGYAKYDLTGIEDDDVVYGRFYVTYKF